MANEQQPGSVPPFMKFAFPLIRQVYSGPRPPLKVLADIPNPRLGDRAVKDGIAYTFQQIVLDPVTIIAALEQDSNATFESVACAWVSDPGLTAEGIISVQPMTRPVGGLAFYKSVMSSKKTSPSDPA